jgi:hypothetical protein
MDRALPDGTPGAQSRFYGWDTGDIIMRLLLGIILGALITIGGAYIMDSRAAANPDTLTTSSKPMVNWDVVSVKWQHLTLRAREEWTRVTG